MAGFKQWHAIVTSGKAMPEVVPAVIGWLNGFQEQHGSPQSDYGLTAGGQVHQYLFASVWIPGTKEMTLVYSDRASAKLSLDAGTAHNMVLPVEDDSTELDELKQQLEEQGQSVERLLQDKDAPVFSAEIESTGSNDEIVESVMERLREESAETAGPSEDGGFTEDKVRAWIKDELSQLVSGPEVLVYEDDGASLDDLP